MVAVLVMDLRIVVVMIKLVGLGIVLVTFGLMIFDQAMVEPW